MEPKDILESFIVSSNTLHSKILWALKVVMPHFSLRSWTGLSKPFKVMFKDSEIASGFVLSRTKCTYLVNFVVAPYLRKDHKSSIKTSSHFVVSFDKSLNFVLQDDQIDVQLRFWVESENLVSTKYFDSKFLKRPNVENFANKLNSSFLVLPLKNMLQLFMDGPRTNWLLDF